jgi:hypothetical protein
MQRRGSTALVTVALTALACGQATPSTEPPRTAPTNDAPTPPAVTVAPSASAAVSPTHSRGAEHGTWQPAARMARERQGFDAVVLGDGRVLAVGSDWDCHPGPAEPGSETAEVYDAVADTWSEVESLNKPRKVPATVVLANGRALVLGGVNSEDVSFSSTKIFDPATRAWTDGPLLEYARLRPSAVRLDDGRVLVVSEDGPRDFVTTAELSDRNLTGWSLVRSLPSRVSVFELVAMRDGRALAIGIDSRESDPVPAALVYDPGENAWTEAAGLARFWAAHVALPDGSVFAIGGAGGGELWGDTRRVVEDVARFDQGTSRWSPIAPMTTPRSGLQATVLKNGQVLVAGGTTEGPTGEQVALRSTELYNPETDKWAPAGDLLEPRYNGRLVALDDGSALILGGTAEYNLHGDTPFCPVPLTTVERFWP